MNMASHMRPTAGLRRLPVLVVAACAVAAAHMTARGAYIRDMGPYTIVADDRGGWEKEFTVEQFDVDSTPWPAYARLLGIEFILTGVLDGNLGIENMDGDAAAQFTVTLSNVLTLSRAGTLITTATPESTTTSTLDAYDDVEDFGGASGETFAVSGSDTGSASTELQNDLDAFTGNGSIVLQVEASDDTILWDVTSGKTYSTIDMPLVGAELTVRYTYIPEPSAGALASMLVLVCALRRRSRRMP